MSVGAKHHAAAHGASWRHPEVRTFGTSGKSGGDDDGGDDYHVLCMTVTVQDSHASPAARRESTPEQRDCLI